MSIMLFLADAVVVELLGDEEVVFEAVGLGGLEGVAGAEPALGEEVGVGVHEKGGKGVFGCTWVPKLRYL